MKHAKLFFLNYCCLSLFSCLFSLSLNAAPKEQAIVVIIPSYHNAQIFNKNLDSLFNQKYDNYRVIYISDGDLLPDSDGTGALVEQYVKEKKQEHRFTLIRNKDRHFALNNTYRAILSCRDDEIFVILDGDDMFAHPNVLKRVNEMYSAPGKEVWFTYGNFDLLSSPGTVVLYATPIPEWVLSGNKFREWSYFATHLRTCRAWLAKQIKVEDFFYDNYFFKTAGDIALLEPIMEMAAGRYQMTHEVLYVYNDMNSINDHKVVANAQASMNKYIRQKERYWPLVENLCGHVDQLKAQGRLVADMVVFSENNPEQLRAFLNELPHKFKDLQTVSIIYTPRDVSEKYYASLIREFSGYRFTRNPGPGRHFKNLVDDVMQLVSSDYVLFADSAFIPNNSIDIGESLAWLETVHAHAFYLNIGKSFFDSLSLDSQSLDSDRVPALLSLQDAGDARLFCWRYAKKLFNTCNRLCNFTLCRKKDCEFLHKSGLIESREDLESAWQRSLQENGVGLFYGVADEKSM